VPGSRVGAQLIGLAIAAPVAVLRGEGQPLPVDVAWSVVSGLIGAVGIGCLYRGLAVGRMGVVAPVTGVLVAVIPVLAGMVLDGVPSAIGLVAGTAALIGALASPLGGVIASDALVSDQSTAKHPAPKDTRKAAKPSTTTTTTVTNK